MGCTNEASSDCGAPEGTEYTGVLIYLRISLSQFIHHPIPAVRDVIYIGPVENTLPSPNPVWLTVKV